MFQYWNMSIWHADADTPGHLVGALSPGSHYHCRLVWGDNSATLSSLQRKTFPSSLGLSALDALCSDFCVCVRTCARSSFDTAVPNTRHTLQLTRWPLTSHLYTTAALLDTQSKRDVKYWPQINTHTRTHTGAQIHLYTNFLAFLGINKDGWFFRGLRWET